VIGAPDALWLLPDDALETALADELLLLLLDEHAPTEIPAVRTAATASTFLRRRTMERFLPLGIRRLWWMPLTPLRQ